MKQPQQMTSVRPSVRNKTGEQRIFRPRMNTCSYGQFFVTMELKILAFLSYRGSLDILARTKSVLSVKISLTLTAIVILLIEYIFQFEVDMGKFMVRGGNVRESEDMAMRTHATVCATCDGNL